MRRSIAGALLVLALLCMTTQACGQFPMGFGFPNAVQTSTSTAWQHDTANAFDYEDFSMVPWSACGFPAIHQTSIHAQSMSHTEFSQTTQFASIGFPTGCMGPFCGFGCGF